MTFIRLSTPIEAAVCRCRGASQVRWLHRHAYTRPLPTLSRLGPGTSTTTTAATTRPTLYHRHRQLHTVPQLRLPPTVTEYSEEDYPIEHYYKSCKEGAANGIPWSELSPAAVARARQCLEEYNRLQAQLEKGYDSDAAKRAGELAPIAGALMRLQEAALAVPILAKLLDDPDPEMQELGHEEVPDVFNRIRRLDEELKLALTPKHEWDDLPCLIEIRPGAGGSEAGLFANEVVQMYHRFCLRRGIKVNIIKYDVASGDAGDRVTTGPSSSSSSQSGPDAEADGDPKRNVKIVLGDDSAQLIEAVLEITTPGSYGTMRTEAGVHRVQRVPATESKGRVHTSSIAVVVLPSFPTPTASDGTPANPTDESSIYYIDPKEVRTDVMRARGAGGQHVNRTESAVRLTHLPTGITVSMQDSRSQPRNKARAWQVLRSRIAARRMDARQAEAKQLRSSIVRPDKIGRESKIRTYNWQQQRVTDHRSGFTSSGDLDHVMAGGLALDTIMDSVKTWMADQEMIALAEQAKEDEAKK